MASTTFSGPIKAGTISNTTGTTLGDNVRNVGQVVMTQSSDVALTHATTTATALGIIIPANSQIINIDIVVEAVFTGSSTTTIAIGNATGTPTNIGAAHNVSATAVGPLKMLQGPDNEQSCRTIKDRRGARLGVQLDRGYFLLKAKKKLKK